MGTKWEHPSYSLTNTFYHNFITTTTIMILLIIIATFKTIYLYKNI